MSNNIVKNIFINSDKDIIEKIVNEKLSKIINREIKEGK